MALRVTVRKAVPAALQPELLRSALLAVAGLEEVAARLGSSDHGVTVRLTGDRELRRLNRRFLGEDRATDVLSFPAGPGPALDAAYLGDLAISWPAVVRQAAGHHHPPAAEASLLAVHGFLHLLGWDHAEPVEEAEMSRLCLAALSRCGIELGPRSPEGV